MMLVPQLCLLSLSLAAAFPAEIPQTTKWYGSRDNTDLSISSSGDLTWNLPTEGSSRRRKDLAASSGTTESILTNLAVPAQLSRVGDSFEVKMQWQSSGINSCPSSYFADGKYCVEEASNSCVTHSPSCLSGTGDFRLAFFDTSKGGNITHGGFSPSLDYEESRTVMSKPPFSLWRSYNLHFFPHVSAAAKKYTPKERGTACPSSFCYRSDTGSAKEDWAFPNHKFGEPFGGFAAPLGSVQDLSFGVRRSSANSFELWVSSDGHSANMTHQWKDSDWQPEWVNSIGIIYPNSRHYSQVKISQLQLLSSTMHSKDE